MFLGAKKADLVALLEKAEAPTSPPVQAEAENSNDIAQEIEKISAEDDLTKVDEDDDEEEAAAEPKKDEKEPGTCSIKSIHQMLGILGFEALTSAFSTNVFFQSPRNHDSEDHGSFLFSYRTRNR